MSRTPDAFLEIAETLCGPSWVSQYSAWLNISDRTLRRMVVGEAPIPDGVWDDVANLCRQRAEKLTTLASSISEPGFQTQVNAHMRAPRPRGSGFP